MLNNNVAGGFNRSEMEFIVDVIKEVCRDVTHLKTVIYFAHDCCWTYFFWIRIQNGLNSWMLKMVFGCDIKRFSRSNSPPFLVGNIQSDFYTAKVAATFTPLPFSSTHTHILFLYWYCHWLKSTRWKIYCSALAHYQMVVFFINQIFFYRVY